MSTGGSKRLARRRWHRSSGAAVSLTQASPMPPGLSDVPSNALPFARASDMTLLSGSSTFFAEYRQIMKKTSENRRGWTRDELDWLRENYPKTQIPMNYIVAVLGHSLCSCYHMAFKLHLKRYEARGPVPKRKRRPVANPKKRGRKTAPKPVIQEIVMTRDDIIETQTMFTDYWMFGKNATPPFMTTTNDV